MCGIVGVVAQRNITNFLLDSLRYLEYRGYDSAGLAVIDKNGRLQRLRRTGKVSVLSKAVEEHNSIFGYTGIAHTRWATHGEPTENNAHPHISNHIIVVHNGIIENYKILRNKLRDFGYVFVSDTDTEVIAHLTHWEQNNAVNSTFSLVKIIQQVVHKLCGLYSFGIIDSRNPNVLVATSFGSPMILGIGNGENFIASDEFALFPITNRFISLEEGDIAEITYCNISIWDKTGKKVTRFISECKIKNNNFRNKGKYDYYMQKEIFEQPIAIRNTLKNRLNRWKIFLPELDKNSILFLSKVEHIQIIACGSSYHSAMVSRYWFEEFIGILCSVEVASEFRYRKPVVYRNSLLIILSQSGETADILAALRLTKKLNYLKRITICNVNRSSLARESDIVLMIRAGIEIGVASTKTFTSQLTLLLILVAYIGIIHNMDKKIEKAIIESLNVLPERIEQALLLDDLVRLLAKQFFKKCNALFLGRGIFYPIAMEGALKLKEISYIHAEAYAAGELKHGPIALIDSNIPVIVLAPNDKYLKKIKSNIEEVIARGAQLYVFTEIDTGFIENKKMKIVSLPYMIETVIAPIVYSIPMQQLAYHVGVVKGTDIDQPRNLAKSVTVE